MNVKLYKSLKMQTKVTKISAKPKGAPLHQVCKENVERPTLVRKNKNDSDVWLQWFGESNLFDLSGNQFYFPINSDAGNFFYQPESFEVIMVGSVKNWPNKEVLKDLIEQCGGEDAIIVYFISSKFGVDDGNGQTIPDAGILPLTIKLLDNNCGVINPQEFFDDSVRIEAIKTFQGKN